MKCNPSLTVLVFLIHWFWLHCWILFSRSIHRQFSLPATQTVYIFVPTLDSRKYYIINMLSTWNRFFPAFSLYFETHPRHQSPSTKILCVAVKNNIIIHSVFTFKYACILCILFYDHILNTTFVQLFMGVLFISSIKKGCKKVSYLQKKWWYA